MSGPLEAEDRADVFVPHGLEETRVDLGEVQLNYARLGNPTSPALLLIPAQTESWWGYEPAMRLLAEHFEVFAVDLRGQGRSTWTPGRYTLDVLGNDLVRFLDRVVGRPAIVAGLSSGGTLSAWLSAYALPGQVVAAVYEDAPLFASEANPATGQSIRQGVGPMFELWHRWLGPQWSIGDWDGLVRAISTELPPALLAGLAAMSGGAGGDPMAGPPQTMREYDPEWGHAFASGDATRACDHETMLKQVKVSVLFTHHFRQVDDDTGRIVGAISDAQVRRVEQLVTGAGQAFTYRSFPDMPHSMHQADPAGYAGLVVDWARHIRLLGADTQGEQ